MYFSGNNTNDDTANVYYLNNFNNILRSYGEWGLWKCHFERDKTRVLFLYGPVTSFLSLPLLPVTLFILMVVNNWYIIMVGSMREWGGRRGRRGGEGGGEERKEEGGGRRGIGSLVVVPFLRLRVNINWSMLWLVSSLYQYCVSSFVGRICFCIPRI